jgi:hypothetical protein
MNVAFQVKVPVSIAVDLQERMRVLQIAHEKEMAQIDKRIRLVDGDPKKLAKTRLDLHHQGRMITANNLLRLAVEHGASKVILMKDDQIMKLLSDTGIARGRPRNG